MRCWRCGATIADGSKFCTECGADQRSAPAPQQPSNPQPVYSQTTQPQPQPARKKGGLLKGILITLLAIAIGRGVGYLAGTGIAGIMNQNNKPSTSSYTSSTSSSHSTGSNNSASTGSNHTVSNNSSSTNITLPKDLITLHKVFNEGGEDGLTAYEVVYYGADTKKILGITGVLLLDKSYGYTRESIEGSDYLSSFPSFAKATLYDDGDHWCYQIVMDDLGNTSRMQQMVDKGYITLVDGGKVGDGGIDSEGYIQSILDLGYRAATAQEISQLHLGG